MYHVHTKFDGYIEDLYVNFVGEYVKKGQPLFSIYSPELYATQNEYLLALRAREQMPVLNQGESESGVGEWICWQPPVSVWGSGISEMIRLMRLKKRAKHFARFSSILRFRDTSPQNGAAGHARGSRRQYVRHCRFVPCLGSGGYL